MATGGADIVRPVSGSELVQSEDWKRLSGSPYTSHVLWCLASLGIRSPVAGIISGCKLSERGGALRTKLRSFVRTSVLLAAHPSLQAPGFFILYTLVLPL